VISLSFGDCNFFFLHKYKFSNTFESEVAEDTGFDSTVVNSKMLDRIAQVQIIIEERRKCHRISFSNNDNYFLTSLFLYPTWQLISPGITQVQNRRNVSYHTTESLIP